MANVNQIRLQQISGSLATIDSGVSGVNSAGALPAALGENTIADMEDIMTYFAQAIANIHGKTNFGTQTPGLISFDASGIDIVLDQDQSGRKIHLDSEGSVDIDAITGLDINVATGGSDARDLAISSTGGGDSSVLISSAGSGADALSLDVSAGSMVVAPSLADGQTLKLGKNGAVEMVFTPHGTPANEKVSLTNTAGTADDAISLVATAGGVKDNGSWTASAGSLEQLDSIATTNLVIEYILYFSHSTGKQAQKVLVLNNGSNSYSQEFGVVFDNNLLVSVGSSIFGGNLTLNATPESGITGTIDWKFLRNDVS